jgi:hypothetical protein
LLLCVDRVEEDQAGRCIYFSHSFEAQLCKTNLNKLCTPVGSAITIFAMYPREENSNKKAKGGTQS